MRSEPPERESFVVRQIGNRTNFAKGLKMFFGAEKENIRPKESA
jgi:hypothetical protein